LHNNYNDNDTLNQKYNEEKPKMNWEIKYLQIRLIDVNGDNLGLFAVKDAIGKAKIIGLDLIEINPMAKPPVCKIMDLGKYMFELKKKKKENTSKQPETKEIRLTPSIGQHDLIIKSKKACEFLDNGSKVIIKFKLKGREAKKYDLIKAIVIKFHDILKDKCILESKLDSYILIPKS